MRASPENRHPPKNRQSPVAVSSSSRISEIDPKSPPRHGSQQGSVSAGAVRLLRLYDDDLRVRYGEATACEYVRLGWHLLRWLARRGLEVAGARTEDLLAYQSDLYAARKGDGRPYSSGSQINRVKALKSFFRFLYRRSVLLYDPAATLEYPKDERRLPRVILTTSEARRILEAPQDRKHRSPCATARSSRRSTARGFAPASWRASHPTTWTPRRRSCASSRAKAGRTATCP